MAVGAVFLDRDGTINTEEDFLSNPELLRFERGAVKGLRLLAGAGFKLVVVSNQSGVARGLFDEQAVRDVNGRLEEMLLEEDIEIAGFYYCPHHPAGTVPEYTRVCQCRKPAPGLFILASKDLDIDLDASFAVGDRARDLEAGRRAGARTVLVLTGYGVKDEPVVREMKFADHVAGDLEDAARWIIADAKAGGRRDER